MIANGAKQPYQRKCFDHKIELVLLLILDFEKLQVLCMNLNISLGWSSQ